MEEIPRCGVVGDVRVVLLAQLGVDGFVKNASEFTLYTRIPGRSVSVFPNFSTLNSKNASRAEPNAP